MSQLIPELVVQVVATVSGVVISVGVPLILAKINKFGKVYTTVFGVENVDSMSGLVGVVEAHDAEIEEVKEEIDEVKEGQEEIKDRIEALKDSVKSRRENNDDS